MRRVVAGARGRLSREDGYTLTEMLVVMAIIGLIAAVLTPGLLGQLGRARVKSAQMQLDTVAAAVEAYRSDVGHYPTDAEGIGALLAEPAGNDGWSGPYIKSGKMQQDPWGNPIVYKQEAGGRSFSLTSYGRDGQAGGTGQDRDLQANIGG